MGKHALPKKRDAQNNPSTPPIRPVLPILALALAGCATLGAAATATTQAVQQHAHRPSMTEPGGRVSSDQPASRYGARTELPKLRAALLKPRPSSTRHDDRELLASRASVVVRINDRGPYLAGRCLDLTPAAFDRIAGRADGTAEVRYEVLRQ